MFSHAELLKKLQENVPDSQTNNTNVDQSEYTYYSETTEGTLMESKTRGLTEDGIDLSVGDMSANI